jgi:PAS domain S-box
VKINQPVTQKERTYSQNLNLISTTDLHSNITDANASFCEIAGFTLDELRNKPHHVVRHPDMPPQAFADMWKHIRQGQSWMGLVKNRCKNGDQLNTNLFVSHRVMKKKDARKKFMHNSKTTKRRGNFACLIIHHRS